MVHITDVKKASANVQKQFGKIDEAIVNSTSATMAMVSSKMCRIMYIYIYITFKVCYISDFRKNK